MVKVFTIVMNKGGCLKTSIATNLGGQLSLNRQRVLLIDLDEQQNVLLTFQQKKTKYDVIDWLTEGADFNDIKVNVSTGLDVINGPSSTYLLEKKIKEMKRQKPLDILKEKIQEIKNDYDYIVIDTPPSFSFSTSMGMAAADDLIVPFQPEMYGSVGLIKTINQINELKTSVNPNVQIKRVVPTKIDKRSKHHKATLKQCKEFLDKNGIVMSINKIWDTKDGINSIFEESRPPVLSRRSNKLKQVYKNLTREVVK